MKKLLLLGGALLLASACSPQTEPSQTTAPAQASVENAAEITDFFAEAWTKEQTAPLLEKTLRLRFDYNDAQLTAGERLHTLYLEQVHPQARAAETAIAKLDGRQDLKDLFRLSKGPITTDLNNERKAFLGTVSEPKGGNIYPAGIERDELDSFLAANPNKRGELLDLRAVVRKASEANKTAAIEVLDRRPTLDVLHPGLRDRIKSAQGYFGLPYSVAYSDDIFFVYDRLMTAADHIAAEDIAFARFLRLRARDMLADNYDGSDAMWVTGEYTGNLNAQIGSYETYDDGLFGVKSFFSLSLLIRDKEKSDELAASIGDIQAIENSLPYTAQKSVSNKIPVAVYNVIADFGQARGTNTATILPNEGHLSRQFGRTILIRSNVLRNEALFATSRASFEAGVADQHHADLALEGNFYRTLWHEIGHYLGPDQTRSGGDIDTALQNSADMIEEMKADLVSLFATRRLGKTGAFTDAQKRAVYAAGILRVLQKNKPRRTQAYGTMKLIQFNWYLKSGLLSYENGKLVIDYSKYHDSVASLLKEILDIQYQGDREATNQFVDQWTSWDEELHGAIGQAMKDAENFRFRLVTYEALGE